MFFFHKASYLNGTKVKSFINILGNLNVKTKRLRFVFIKTQEDELEVLDIPF